MSSKELGEQVIFRLLQDIDWAAASCMALYFKKVGGFGLSVSERQTRIRMDEPHVLTGSVVLELSDKSFVDLFIWCPIALHARFSSL
jgi:hypothetical protein